MDLALHSNEPTLSGSRELVLELTNTARILIVCLSHSWGGLEQVAANDALEMAALGLDVRLLCIKNSPICEHVQQKGKIKIIPIEFRPRNYFDFQIRGVVRELVAGGVNVIHLHQPSLLGSFSPWLWHLPGVVLLASRHIMSDHSKKNPFHKFIYQRLDMLIVMSQAMRRNVLATHPLRARKVKVVHLGLDFDRFDPNKVDPHRKRAIWGADDDTVVIGMVGRIDPAKGQATFIRAAAGLTKRLRKGEKIKFVIVGEETLGSTVEYLKELKEMVDQFRIEDHVIFAGYQDDIPEIVRAFDIFVMPSRQEAFGLVAIEAMAMECPIVISRGGSANEIVGDEEFGLLIRPDDAFDLQRQLRYLLDNPLERVQMGQAARAHVMKNYDWKFRIHKTLALYRRTLATRKVIE